jgi:arsenite methyltransferase
VVSPRRHAHRIHTDCDLWEETYGCLSQHQLTTGKMLVGELAIGPGDRVLKLGCGTGQLSEFLARIVGLNGEVVGIDPVGRWIDAAHRSALPNCPIGPCG